MTTHEAALTVEGLTKRYGLRKPAVDGLSFTAPRGKICGFLGPNGAGKTTTLRAVLGVVAPDAGRISLLGEQPGPRVFDRVGFLPEERGLYRKMTAEAVITFFGRLKGVPAREARQRARALLEQYGLGAAARKKIRELSKGMAQKVQILASIVHEPEFVILDEPFSGLDPVNQSVLEGLVRGLRDRGATVLFSTHVMEHAERLCDKIVLLADGKKVFDGDVEEALARVPRHIILEVEGNADVAARLTLPGLDIAPAAIDPGDPTPQGVQRWRIGLVGATTPQDVLRQCVESGLALSRFEPTRAHLHDAFVHLVAQSQGAA